MTGWSQLDVPTVADTSRIELFCPACGEASMSLAAEFTTPGLPDLTISGPPPKRAPRRGEYPELIGWRLYPCDHSVSGEEYLLWTHGLPGWAMFIPRSWGWL